MDAADLEDLPLTNDDPTLPSGVDVEEFWRADFRKPTRVLLRHGDNAVAIAVAKAAAKVIASFLSLHYMKNEYLTISNLAYCHFRCIG
jgi:hypothetical protein